GCRLDAVVALAAGPGECLAEIAKQRHASAFATFGKAQEGFQACLTTGSLGGCALLDKPPLQERVAAAVEKQATGGQSIAAGASDFLIVTFQILGQVGVDDKTDIGLVDSHSESDRGYHQWGLVLNEALLIAAADVIFKSSVV